ncbi:SMP-30/gluconolactonase/LRE family protein [Nannocystaceae bacterium ST9]
MRRAPIAVSLATLALVGCAHEPTPAPDPILAALDRIHAEDPEDGAAIWVLARIALGEGDEARALALLAELSALPDWDHPLRDEDFAAIADQPAFVALAEPIRARAPSREHGPIAFELERGDLRPEGVAWDPTRGQLLIGSMALRSVFVADDRGRLRELVAPASGGLLGVLGIDVDLARDRLWVIGVGLPEMLDWDPARHEGRGALHAFTLAEGRALGRWDAPRGSALNDLVVLADGRVIATDSIGGGLFEIPAQADSGTLEPLLPAGTLFAPNGIVAAEGERALFVSDFRGLHRVELDSLTTTFLAPPEGVATLGGIDGLERHGDALIGIQNLFGAARVWALRLDHEGRSIDAAELLDVDHPRHRTPTTGAIVGDRLLYVGESEPPDPARGHAILAVDLGS